MWDQSLGEEDSPEEKMTTYSGILASKSHAQRSLVGYSLLVCEESDPTGRRSTHTHVLLDLRGISFLNYLEFCFGNSSVLPWLIIQLCFVALWSRRYLFCTLDYNPTLWCLSSSSSSLPLTIVSCFYYKILSSQSNRFPALMDSVLPNRTMVSGFEIGKTQRGMPAHGPKMEKRQLQAHRASQRPAVSQEQRRHQDSGWSQAHMGTTEEMHDWGTRVTLTASRKAGSKSKTKLQTHCCLQWNISSRSHRRAASQLPGCLCRHWPSITTGRQLVHWPGQGQGDHQTQLAREKNKCRNKKKTQNCLLKTVMRQKSNSKNTIKSQMLEKRKSNPISEREERDKIGRNLYPDLKESLICVCFSNKKRAVSSRRFLCPPGRCNSNTITHSNPHYFSN